MDMDFATSCPLVRPAIIRIRFLFVGPRLCSTFPPDSPSRFCPLPPQHSDARALSYTTASDHSPLGGPDGMTRVSPGKSRVGESRTPGSVRVKAEWLSYSTTTQPLLPGTRPTKPTGPFEGPACSGRSRSLFLARQHPADYRNLGISVGCRERGAIAFVTGEETATRSHYHGRIFAPSSATVPPISPRFLNTTLNSTETPGVTSPLRIPDCVTDPIKAMHSSW
jgi:hypothetical protein